MTPRDRRALILGGAALGLAVLLFRVVPWGWGMFAGSRDALRGRAERLEWMRQRVAGTPALEDSGATVRDKMAQLAPALLAASSATEAAADLGSRLTLAAEQAHVRVSRTDALEDSAAAGLARRVSLRAGLDSDTRGLLGMLASLARDPSPVLVDELRVAAEPATEPEALHTEITVRGWYLPKGGRR